MAACFAYQVCQQQANRITFVNGEWVGSVPLGSADSETSLDACPNTWDYLAAAGKGGWELVAVLHAGSPENPFQLLYLKHAS